MTPADEQDLRAAIDATLHELADDGADDAMLAEFAAHVVRGLDALADELLHDAAAAFAPGDPVPDFLPRVAVAAEFDPGDPRLIVERFSVAGRLAVRRWRIGEAGPRVARFC